MPRRCAGRAAKFVHFRGRTGDTSIRAAVAMAKWAPYLRESLVRRKTFRRAMRLLLSGDSIKSLAALPRTWNYQSPLASSRVASYPTMLLLTSHFNKMCCQHFPALPTWCLHAPLVVTLLVYGSLTSTTFSAGVLYRPTAGTIDPKKPLRRRFPEHPTSG